MQTVLALASHFGRVKVHLVVGQLERLERGRLGSPRTPRSRRVPFVIVCEDKTKTKTNRKVKQQSASAALDVRP